MEQLGSTCSDFDSDTINCDNGVGACELTTMAKHHKTGFLDLPPELRNDVYLLFLPCDAPIELECCWSYTSCGPSVGYLRRLDSNHPSGQLLRTSKTINDEASPVLYGANTFRFWNINAVTLFLGRARGFVKHIHRMDLSRIEQNPDLALVRLQLASCLQEITMCIDLNIHTPRSFANALRPLAVARKKASSFQKHPLEIVHFYTEPNAYVDLKWKPARVIAMCKHFVDTVIKLVEEDIGWEGATYADRAVQELVQDIEMRQARAEAEYLEGLVSRALDGGNSDG